MENFGVDEESWEEKIGDFLQEVLNHGFQLPIHWVVISSTGGMMMGRYDDSPTRPFHVKMVLLCQFLPEEMEIPVNLVFIDKRGELARIIFRKSNKKEKFQYLS